MGLLLILGGFSLLALPGCSAPLGRRLPAAEWARLCQLAVLAGVVVVETALVLYALPTVLRAAGVPALAAMCERALRGFVPGGTPAGWVAAVVAAATGGMGVVGAVRARRGCRAVRAESWLGEHGNFDGYDLVVLPTDQVIALSVADGAGQILVSRGLVDALTDDELEMVVRHEAAHLDLGHQRWLGLAAALDRGFGFFWPAKRSTEVLRASLERCADDAATGDDPQRRAQLRAALLGLTAMAVGAELAAFSAADTVVERLDALRRDRPQPRVAVRGLLYLPGVSVASMVLFAAGAWGGEARMLIAMAGRCPI